MPPWPPSPICAASVSNYRGGTWAMCGFDANAPSRRWGTGPDVEFVVRFYYSDHPYFDHGQGWMGAYLNRKPNGGTVWELVDYQEVTLGDDTSDGDWQADVSLRHAMTQEYEVYDVWVHCGTQKTSFGNEVWNTRQFEAFQHDFPEGLRTDSERGSIPNQWRFQVALRGPFAEGEGSQQPVVFGLGPSESEREYFEKHIRRRRRSGE